MKAFLIVAHLPKNKKLIVALGFYEVLLLYNTKCIQQIINNSIFFYVQEA